MRRSALSAFDEAVVGAVESDAWMQVNLAEWDGAPAIFSARAPREAGFPRIIIGEAAEDARSVFGARGNTGPTQLHIWTVPAGRMAVNDIYGELVRLFEGSTLEMEGHLVYRCGVRLLSNLPDPVEDMQHGVVELTPWSVNA